MKYSIEEHSNFFVLLMEDIGVYRTYYRLRKDFLNIKNGIFREGEAYKYDLDIFNKLKLIDG